MTKKSTNRLMTIIYTVLVFCMYRTSYRGFQFAGIMFLYRYLWALLIFLLSLGVFLVEVNLERAKELARRTALVCLPYVVTLLISVPIWVIRLNPFGVMRRGLFNQLYQIITVFAMAGMLYVLGERAVRCCLTAMLTVNSVRLLEVLKESGLNQYLSELWRAIVTFAGEVGPAIGKMEVHELTFSFGLFVVFLIAGIRNGGKRMDLFFFLASVFFFLSGFKRIGILAIVVAIALYVFLEIISGHGERWKNILFWSGVIVIAVMLLYVAVISMGALEYLQEQMGINLMGRDHLLELVRPYFHFGPKYYGYGVGFTVKLLDELKGTGLHNDVLALYIDLGFCGFLLWMAVSFLAIPLQATKWQGMEGGILALSYNAYLMATALTDNTTNYTFLTGTIALLIMAYKLEDSSIMKRGKEHEIEDKRNMSFSGDF